jgi:hypothetical protein
VVSQVHKQSAVACDFRGYFDRLLVFAAMAAAFPNISYVNFNHDEIRGMARDSRSLRSGLSNAQLLAKDMNTLQASVHKHVGKAGRAMYWDDMVNPDHNGGQENYQKSSGGGRPGKTDGALLDKLVDPSVLWFSCKFKSNLPLLVIARSIKLRRVFPNHKMQRSTKCRSVLI